MPPMSREPRRERVLTVLRSGDQPAYTAAEIAAITRDTYTGVHGAIRDLIDAGLVSRQTCRRPLKWGPIWEYKASTSDH